MRRKNRKYKHDEYSRMTLRPRTPFMDLIPNEEDMSADQRLWSLIRFVNSRRGEVVVRWAHRETLTYKKTVYSTLVEEAERDVDKERELIHLKIPDLKRTSQVQGDHDNWLIFDSISKKYIEAKDRASIFDAVRMRAEAKLQALDELPHHYRLSSPLSNALRQLSNFKSQYHIVGTVVDIVDAFLKNPNLVRTKFLNFILAGQAGTGKTTLAGVVASCLASAGMFVDNRVVLAGRAELVAEYEGQTVAKTNHFLVSNLDSGVIFIDEAYGITQWNDGKPESYGTEAVTAMVEFMSRYKGLYCIILAGYEKEIQRYFLSTNPGLTRRFPFRFVLHDLSPNRLTQIFKRTLLTEQGYTVDPGEGEEIESHSYFTEEAWMYLTQIVAFSTSGRVDTIPEEYDSGTRQIYKNVTRFLPSYPHMNQLFMNQAGSMTNLAEECITVLVSKVPLSDPRGCRNYSLGKYTLPRMNGVSVMKRVVRQRILNSSMSAVPLYMRELEFMEGELPF